jgi:diguanylate cyclase (GGDEF)-like protein/PAS domain S-box-containing protein
VHRTKKILFIAGCLTNIVGLWIALAFQFDHDRTQAHAAAEINASNLARVIEENVLRTVQHIDWQLLDLREEYQRDPRQFSAKLKSRTLPDSAGIVIQTSVIDANGILVGNDQVMPSAPLDLSDREHFRFQAMSPEDKLFISKPVLGRVSQKWSIQFTRRILRKDGSFGGVMVLSVDPEYFSGFFRTVDIGKRGAITLLGSDHVVLARSVKAESVVAAKGRIVYSDSPLFDMSKPSAGTYRKTSLFDGVVRIVAYRRLQQYPLVVRVALAEDEVYGVVDARKRVLIIIGLLATAGLLVALWVILLFEKQQHGLHYRLGESEEFLRTITDHVPGALYLLRRSPDGKLAFPWCSSRMLEISGFDAATLTVDADKAFHLIYADDAESVREQIETSARDLSVFRSEWRYRRPGSNKHRWFRCEAVPHRESDGSVVWYGYMADIQDLKVIEEQLKAAMADMEHLASTDYLTRLPNRRFFFNQATAEFARSKRYGHPLSAIMMDVDHFKQVNDLLGHAAGDAALLQIAEIIQECVRESDVVARYGGEEFAILLPETDLGGALAMAERLRSGVESSPLDIEDGNPHRITVSLGVAAMNRENDFTVLDKLLQKADEALYQAKNSGRNRVVI